MQFRYPEIFYFLPLLLIPIIVHLSQLRRFKRQEFSNVRMLQELSLQTRKSSKIKKWLLLCTRLLLLLFLIFAFAQPFLEARDKNSASNELYILLDNSFSMQAKGKNGELMRRAAEDLLEDLPDDRNFSLLTADAEFWNTDIKAIARDLQRLPYSPEPFRLDNLMARLRSRNSRTGKDIVILTDGTGFTAQDFQSIPKDANVHLVPYRPERTENVSLDSVYLNQTLDNFYEIGIRLRANEAREREVPVSLTNDGKLIAKAIVKMDGTVKNQLFMIPRADFQGNASITDDGLSYDDTYYFSIAAPKKINVLAIGSADDSKFLSRIYTSGEFNYKEAAPGQLDYSLIPQQDAIVVNGLEEIPAALQSTLKDFYAKGGNLILIPSAESDVSELNSFVSGLGSVKFEPTETRDRLVTKISYSHPLYSGVFERRITNFQYPKINGGFVLKSAAAPILQFEGNDPLLVGLENGVSSLYVFSAPLDKGHGNFQNSPLVVPTFYNMARNAQHSGITSLTIGRNQDFMVAASLGKEAILSVGEGDKAFIPEQQALADKVRLRFSDLPAQAGNYRIHDKDNTLAGISFNYARTESAGTPAEDYPDAVQKRDSVAEVMDLLARDRSQTDLWKIMAALALLFLIIELLIQKFVK